MHNLSAAKVLVIGDIMLDNYWVGQTTRISPEAPVPVVHIKEQYAKAGGAGNVALNITSLLGKAILLGLTGNDEAASTLGKILNAGSVNCEFEQLAHKPTITKLRILSQSQQLIRTDFEESFVDVPKQSLLERFKTCLPNCNAVIISDYGKGTLTETQSLIKAARQLNIPVIVDPKGSDFTAYHGASMITPNLKEFEAVVGPCLNEADMVEKGLALIRTCHLDSLLVTRGPEGMTLIRPDHAPVHMPTEAREVFDVTGAGDTVIAVMGMAIGAGYDMPSSMRLANAAAGVVVGKIGTATVSPDELEAALHQDHHLRKGEVSEDQLKKIIKNLRLRGEKVVFTNGCFDILHAGHVDYLQAARALGDHLILAVNTDDSIKRLKGPERPINPLEQRMRVLAALGCVDWVIPFSEDTPERLITSLLPDILVKGADYQVHQIAGAKQVLANGGEVKTIELTPGCSTTNIINKAKSSGGLS
ncbi:MAG: bifunctional D-glycero-beta-D-manno-heptose-7-phosphate kinase/D-glycero-beta-D-manno-heptose 1-phosphate adenylyltransferase HldE [Gammaproteobacteria bacterium]|nr:bifunctional D-glycero-beta-D-manno-heptose-7-phosphate kinase/D-glycero-beta-D-manno-heptose 1-phosphate adenylyltransferase HldE [Gammaproteobacteria bacterium]